MLKGNVDPVTIWQQNMSRGCKAYPVCSANADRGIVLHGIMRGFIRAAGSAQSAGARPSRRARFRPENTLPAFEYAIGNGVDALELDMAVTKDNVIVVSHDPLLHPPVCSGPAPEARFTR